MLANINFPPCVFLHEHSLNNQWLISQAFSNTVYGNLNPFFLNSNKSSCCSPLCLLQVSCIKFLSLHHSQITGLKMDVASGTVPWASIFSQRVYIMYYLTVRRLCEHSSALSKLTVCPLKDYRCDRIHKTPLCLLLAVSYFIIFTNRAVRRCRWGGQWITQTSPCSTKPLISSLTLHPSCSVLAVSAEERWSWSFMQLLPHPSKAREKKDTKTQKTKKHRKCDRQHSIE